MNWIFDHFQIVVLVALGVGSMLKSVLERSKSAREQEEEYDPEEVFIPEEEYRGMTIPSVPPPITSNAVPPPLREFGREEAIAIEDAKVLKHQLELAERLRRIQDTKATTTGGAAATSARLARKGSAKAVTMAPTSIRSRLRNTDELRRSIVMREILNPPVSQR